MTKVVIIGGGFGGIYTAKRLEKIKLDTFDIELISNNNYFIFQPLLPEVISGVISASDAVTPIRQMLKSIKFRHAEVNSIDLEKKNVGIIQGFKKRQHYINYDHLIIALGQENKSEIVPGLKNNSFKMKSLQDAYNIRNHIIKCLELADITFDYKLKKSLLSFVVIGGGFSGVETTGEIREMIDKLLIYYKNIKKSEIKIHVVETSDKLLPELDPKISIYTQNFFKKMNINVHLNNKVREVSSLKVYLSNYNSITTNTVISTIGAEISNLIKKTQFKLKEGKILTNKFFEVENQKNVWALGDCAFVPLDEKNPHESSPPTAQFAVRQARVLSDNILLKVLKKELKPFKYVSKGALASLGSRIGVGRIYSITIKGFIAWIIWRIFYLSFLPSTSTKIKVFVGWILQLIIPRNAVLTESVTSNSFEFKNYKKNDVVFLEGMLADGFYIVQSGEFLNTYKKTRDGKIFKKIYKKGEHFGSRVLLENGQSTGTIRATRDSKVLKIDKESFRLMVSNLPMLRKYFNDYLPKNFKNLKLPL